MKVYYVTYRKTENEPARHIVTNSFDKVKTIMDLCEDGYFWFDTVSAVIEGKLLANLSDF